jgi:hypothetical protein
VSSISSSLDSRLFSDVWVAVSATGISPSAFSL